MARHGEVFVNVPGEARSMRIAYSEAGNRSGPPLLFIHGLGVCRHTWLETMLHPAWRDVLRQYHCIMIDLPGFGDSGYQEGRYSLSRYADSVLAAAGALCDEPPVLVGNSLGATIAFLAALKAPRDIRAVVAQGAPVSGEDFSDADRAALDAWLQYADTHIAQSAAGRFIEDFPLKLFSVFRVANPLREMRLSRFLNRGEVSRLRRLMRTALISTGKHDRRAFYEILLDLVHTNDLEDRLHELSVPLLLIDGHPALRAVDTLQKIDALTQRVPQKHVVRIEGTGHLAPFIAVEQFASALADFLAELKT